MSVQGSSDSSDQPKTVILMCHPRSTSTAFERAFLNRDDFRVLHEPMGDAWYFGPQKTSPRYGDDICQKDYAHLKDLTYEKEWRNITHAPDGKRTFVKDMAQYYLPPTNAIPSTINLPEAKQGNPTFLPIDTLFRSDIIFTFLIRSPEKAVPSYYRLCSGDQCDVTGFRYFDPAEVGLRELRTFYELVLAEQKKRGIGTEHAPIIIDSGDLVDAPEKYMAFYCKTTGVDFSPSMLEWKTGNQEHFNKWRGWHTDAENSTGISSKRKSTADSVKEWPEIVTKTIADNMEDYHWLHARRVRL